MIPSKLRTRKIAIITINKFKNYIGVSTIAIKIQKERRRKKTMET